MNSSNKVPFLMHHSISHKNLPKNNIDEKINEISKSKNFFKEEFNNDVNFFSYPYRSYDNETIKIIKKYYEFAVTTRGSRYTKDKFNKYFLPRVPIRKNDSLIKFFLKIKTPYEDIKYKND
jgi:peptidoglycan/xylan/chitin deacetylase (PgdA/CDA1 family)